MHDNATHSHAISVEADSIRLSLHCHRCGTAHEFDASLTEAKYDTNRERHRIGWHRRRVDGVLRDHCDECTRVIRSERYTPTGNPPGLPSKIDLAEAIELFNSGWTLQKLGDRYGVSRERVRQRLVGRVDKDRKRPATCSECGTDFAVDAKSTGPKAFCSDECRAASKKRSFVNKCKCGGIKNRSAEHCMKCRGREARTFDYQVAGHLYSKGATAKQIGDVLRVKPITVRMAVMRLGVPLHGRGFRRKLTIAQIRRLATDYRRKESP